MARRNLDFPFLAVQDSVEHGVEGRYYISMPDGRNVTPELLEKLLPAMRFYRKHRREIKRLLAAHYK